MSSSCPKIDIHTHILPEHLPDFASMFGYGNWVRLEHNCDCKARMYKGQEFFREIEENCYRGDPRLSDCDESGVLIQALSTVPVMFSYWAEPLHTLEISRFLNDHLLELVRQHPRRFVALATLPMQAPELAINELKRCMNLGFAGIQIGTHINEMPLGDPKLFPIFEACEQLGASVFVHPWFD
jgi:aminocarboxymuconate-semialdehyde decarboxylase